jgi:hypothetical protein
VNGFSVVRAPGLRSEKLATVAFERLARLGRFAPLAIVPSVALGCGRQRRLQRISE